MTALILEGVGIIKIMFTENGKLISQNMKIRRFRL